MTPKPTLVIGANGFLGSHVTRQLVTGGAAVRVMVRPGANTVGIDDLQVTRPALGYALNGVGYQSPRQSMQSSLRIVLADGHNVAILLLHRDAGRKSRVQLALRPLHQHRVAFDFDRHPFGDRDRFFSNS